jgi:hypothetical protein
MKRLSLLFSLRAAGIEAKWGRVVRETGATVN